MSAIMSFYTYMCRTNRGMTYNLSRPTLQRQTRHDPTYKFWEALHHVSLVTLLLSSFPFNCTLLCCAPLCSQSASAWISGLLFQPPTGLQSLWNAALGMWVSPTCLSPRVPFLSWRNMFTSQTDCRPRRDTSSSSLTSSSLPSPSEENYLFVKLKALIFVDIFFTVLFPLFICTVNHTMFSTFLCPDAKYFWKSTY